MRISELVLNTKCSAKAPLAWRRIKRIQPPKFMEFGTEVEPLNQRDCAGQRHANKKT